MPSLEAAKNISKPATLFHKGNTAGRRATAADAPALVQMYESALGKGGVGKPACEPYPDPSLFDAKAMAENIERGRIIILTETEGTVSGAIALDALGPFQIENNCMAVRRDMRGRGVGTALIHSVSAFLSQTELTINCTELVTHSMASQAAHAADGYDTYCGFGFCHYPRVFFANHPESVLWTWRAYGRALSDGYSGDSEAGRLARSLREPRTIYVPPRYAEICHLITRQLKPLASYQIGEGQAASGTIDLTVQASADYEHAYVLLDELVGHEVLPHALAAVDDLLATKRYVVVRIPANNSNCAAIAERLYQRGFAFHSLLPFYGWNEKTRSFFDVFAMQYIEPSVLAKNALPGETDSVVKLYGYPATITGALVRTVGADLRRFER